MRTLLVDQRESDLGEFWYVLRSPNRIVMTTSEMYESRSNAIRAARRFIGLIAPVPVVFSYWTGQLPPCRAESRAAVRRKVAELIRFDDPRTAA